jgi:hypothetical protein
MPATHDPKAPKEYLIGAANWSSYLVQEQEQEQEQEQLGDSNSIPFKPRCYLPSSNRPGAAAADCGARSKPYSSPTGDSSQQPFRTSPCAAN